MSLEAKIELLTAAVVELTRVMQSQQPGAVHFAAHTQMAPLDGGQQSAKKPLNDVVTVSTQEESVSGTPQNSVSSDELPNVEPETPTPTTSTSPASSNECVPVNYEDVKAVTIAVSKIGKAKAVAGLARFGVTTAKALSEAQWPEYVDYMKKIEAGEIDPESSHE